MQLNFFLFLSFQFPRDLFVFSLDPKRMIKTEFIENASVSHYNLMQRMKHENET
jgi:hypothetical protein